MRTETTGGQSITPVLNRIQNGAYPILGIGAIGLIAALLTQTQDPRAFWGSYFYGYFFWMGLTLGSATLLYLHNSIRALWGLSILRFLEASTRLLPWMALGMIPILIAVWTGHLYDWANPDIVKHWDPLHQDKAKFYLNATGFTIRQICYWAFWIYTTTRLRNSSVLQDKTMNERLGRERASFAAPIGVIHVIVVTFAYTDWLLSLTNFYSTMYGAWNITKNILAALSLFTILVLANRDRKPFSDIVTPELTRDLGNFTLGWVMFWGYTSLDQFLIIWSGNLPDEILFYTSRFEGGLVYVGALIVAFQFFAPFLALITGRTKRTPEIMLKVAIWIFVMRLIDTWYDIVPFFRRGIHVADMPYIFNPVYLIFDIAALAAFGGFWLALFAFYAKKEALYPAHDPRLIEAKELATHGAH